MSMKAAFLALFAASVLAGCGAAPVDDPANVPLLGSWRIETRVDSVAVDNQRIGRAAFAQMAEGEALLSQVEGTQIRACAEPSLTSRNIAASLLSNRIDDCTAAPDAPPGGGRVQCRINAMPATLTLTGFLDRSSGDVRVTVDIDARGTAEPMRVSLQATQRLTRVGDCS